MRSKIFAVLALAALGCDPNQLAAVNLTAVLQQKLNSPIRQDSCPLPPTADPSKLVDVMGAGFSPLLSKLSFTIVHDDQSSGDQRREAVISNTAALLGCIQLAGGDRPTSHANLLQRYLELMVDARETVALLQLTAIEGDGDASAHWFDHTRMACDRCHLLYKPGSVE
jgi:hypothetical protein